jgi:MFS transporter, DHA1 family, multidrug resistance protein
MATFGIFVALCFPTAFVNNFAAFLVLRFLQGFFGSPCLATGGASLADLYSLLKLPYSLTVWASFATCGPAMGPIISGFSVPAKNWHWSLWEILWIAGPVFIIMMLFLPETSSSNILLRRAARLRKLTGNPNLKSQAELDQSKLSVSAVAYESLFRPWQVMFLDPAILFINLYTALVYGIYYSFFEVFPIVYIGFYGFNLGEMGLTFLSITVSDSLAIPCYYAYLYYLVEPEIKKNGIGAPEGSLIPALFVSFLLPIGLFMFGAYKPFPFIIEAVMYWWLIRFADITIGWTSNPHVHWIVSLIGVTIYGFGVFILLQCIL